jgi:hypothetical protein
MIKVPEYCERGEGRGRDRGGTGYDSGNIDQELGRGRQFEKGAYN